VTTVEAVRQQLQEIVDPCSAATGSNLDIVEMGLIDSIEIDDSHVDVNMRLTTPACHMVPYFVREVEEYVGELSGIDSVELETDNGLEWTEEMMSEKAKARREELFARQAAEYRDELEPPTQGTKNQRGES
jgi:metal-sulfur cluster biosynthetic enzyme